MPVASDASLSAGQCSGWRSDWGVGASRILKTIPRDPNSMVLFVYLDP